MRKDAVLCRVILVRNENGEEHVEYEPIEVQERFHTIKEWFRRHPKVATAAKVVGGVVAVGGAAAVAYGIGSSTPDPESQIRGEITVTEDVNLEAGDKMYLVP